MQSCPADYRTDPGALRRAAELRADTLYVVGGLYGNPEALAAIERLRRREARNGCAVTLVFSGDFHWFDVDARAFARIGAAVLRHPAIRGNVEAELARDGGSLDCGCSYPPYVGGGVPERSNAIFARLARTAAGQPGQRARLAGLPSTLVAEVGGRRIAILHGDPESLAGWSLAQEALASLEGPTATAVPACGDGAPADAGAPQTPRARIEGWFRAAGVDAFATTHTCLPFARDFHVDGTPRLVINNGSAGMPNFAGRREGLITRISARAAVPSESLYGCALNGVRYDAIPVPYDAARWLRRFEAAWPPGSPAHRSYHARIAAGPDYRLEQAARGTVPLRPAAGPGVQGRRASA